MATVTSLKSELRKQVLAARAALDPTLRRAHASAITARLLALPRYDAARCVLAYLTFGDEFDTAGFVADLRGSGKRLALPRVDRASRSLHLHAVGDPAHDTVPGVWGIREPRVDACPRIALSDVDFVLVPGVAFTPRCERLGYGGGYYDRLIAAFAERPALVAAAFELQIVADLPLTLSDQAVDVVVTERTLHTAASTRHLRAQGT